MNIPLTTISQPKKVRQKRAPLKGTKTLDDLLAMFPRIKGYQQRVRRFIRLCQEYLAEYEKDERLKALGIPNPKTRRSDLHNRIMGIVQKLFLQPNAEEIFGGHQPSRRAVRGMIVRKFTKPKLRFPRRVRKLKADR